jgi:hypothetical protein
MGAAQEEMMKILTQHFIPFEKLPLETLMIEAILDHEYPPMAGQLPLSVVGKRVAIRPTAAQVKRRAAYAVSFLVAPAVRLSEQWTLEAFR